MKISKQVEKGYRMGWMAETNIGTLVFFYEEDFKNFHLACSDGTIDNYSSEELDKLKIISWKYAGELAGNEPIPEGQVFIKKGVNVNMVWVKDDESHGDSPDCITLQNEDGGHDTFDKSEIEPYFE